MGEGLFKEQFNFITLTQMAKKNVMELKFYKITFLSFIFRHTPPCSVSFTDSILIIALAAFDSKNGKIKNKTFPIIRLEIKKRKKKKTNLSQ